MRGAGLAVALLALLAGLGGHAQPRGGESPVGDGGRCRPTDLPAPAPDACAGEPPSWPAVPQRLRGAVFHGTRHTPLLHCVTTRVVHSFCDVQNVLAANFNPDFRYRMRVLSPSVTRLANGQLLATFRAMPRRRSRQCNGLARFLVQATLDEGYRLATPVRAVGIPAPHHPLYSGPVDPRLFEVNGSAYLLVELQRPGGGWAEGGRPVPEGGTFLWAMDGSRLTSLRLFRAGARLPQAVRDKNWVPLVVDGTDLLVVRNYDPLQVLRCSVDGRCDVLQPPQPREAAVPLRYLRGGTPLLHYAGPYYVGLAHGNYGRCRAGWSWYTHQLILFKTRPHLAVVYVSDPLAVEVLAGSGPAPPPFLAHFCFPLGAVLRDRDTLDYGVHCDDRRSFMVRMTGLRPLLQRAMDFDASLAAAPPAPGALQAYYAALHRPRCNASRAVPFRPQPCSSASRRAEGREASGPR